MSDSREALFQLLSTDRRYKLEAYVFVYEALTYAQEKMSVGSEYDSSETLPAEPTVKEVGKKKQRRVERHLTGQELCEAIRRYALEQYGLMARTVLKSWGVTKTGDFGEIVYNLISIKQMKKTKDDRREDFDDVYDFNKAFDEDFEIGVPQS